MSFWVSLTSLNLFNSYSNNFETIRRERLKTRVFLLLFSLSLIAIAVYAALSVHTTTITNYSPTEIEFQQLLIRYADTIRCPCARGSIPFSEFIRLEVTYHAVCSSDFIAQTWIDATFSENIALISPLDVRKTLSAFWQSIRSLCTLVKTAVSDGLVHFNTAAFLSPVARTREYLEIQARLTLRFWLKTSLAKLQRDLLMTRQTIFGNRFISGLNTNYRIELSDDVQTETYAKTKANVFSSGCSCLESSGCVQPTRLLENNSATEGTIVPGMMFNCQPFDGVLTSSLECFYRSSCLSLLQRALLILVTPPLLDTAGSRFSTNATIQALIDELMIEQLIDTTLFPQYYSRCNPTYCTYSYTRRFDTRFIVTLIVSAFGGLSIILKLISPLLIESPSLIRLWWTRRNVRSANNMPQPLLQRE